MFENAINDCTKIIKQNDHYKEVYYYRADSYFYLGEYQKALDDYDKSICTSSYDYEHYKNTIYNRAVCKQKLYMYEEAINDFNVFISSYPNSSFAYYDRAFCNLGLNNYDKAIDDISILTKKSAENELIFNDLNLCEKWINDINKIIEEEKDLIKKSVLYYFKGILNSILKNYDEAVKNYTNALLNEYDLHIYYYRALSYFKLNLYQNAIDDYTKIIELDNDYREVYYYRAANYFYLGEYQKALDDYENALMTFSESYSHYEKIIYYRAVCKQRLSLYNEAIDDFNYFISLDNNNNTFVYFDIALCYLELENYEEAVNSIKLFEKNIIGLEKHKFQLSYIDYIDKQLLEENLSEKKKCILYYFNGILNYISENFEEAIKNFESSIEINDKYFLSFYNIGICYMRLKNYDKALEYFNKSYQTALKNNDEYKINLIIDNIKKLALENIEPATEFLKNNNIYY